MKCLILLLGLFSPFSIAYCQSPISLSEQDFLTNASANNHITFGSTDTIGVRALENLGGANTTWNFAGRTYIRTSDSSTATVLSYPGGAPLANDPDFTGSTNVIKTVPSNSSDAILYTFIKLTATGEWELGVVKDSAGNATKVTSYNPPLQQYAFPLTYGTSWSSTSSTFTNTLPPGASLTSTDSDIVDGWGTLELPGGLNVPALRLRKSLTVQVSALEHHNRRRTTTFPG